MFSQELLQMITRNHSTFIVDNLKRRFTTDPFSGSLTVRVTDPGFLTQNSTGACIKSGKLCICRKTAKTVKRGKNKKSAAKLTRTCQLLDNAKTSVSNKFVGRKVNKISALLARAQRCERSNKIKK